jgi:hypothetical protein
MRFDIFTVIKILTCQNLEDKLLITFIFTETDNLLQVWLSANNYFLQSDFISVQST